MKIVQLSIFVENREGRLADIMAILAEAKINIRALSLADTADFGVLRMIVDTPDKAITFLKSKDVVVKTTDIIAVEVEDQPGGLAKVLNVFKNAKINIEYMYAFVEKNNSNAVMVFRVEKPEEAIKKIIGVKILKAEDVYKL
ncbi:MAG: ACT domain-containing protein [bacterium]